METRTAAESVLARARVRRRDALARRQFGRDRMVRRFAHVLNDRRGNRCPHRFDVEICTHGSLQARRESNPNPSSSQYSPAPLNAVLGNTLNPALMRARKFSENFSDPGRLATASG